MYDFRRYPKMKKTLSLLLAALIFALLLSGCGSSDQLTLNV